jgi:hypothetical protein
MSMTDADIADDQANFVMTEWEEGSRPDDLRAQADYPCGCKAEQHHGIDGWQWFGAPDCDDERHRARK